jgi:Flp pilus assembly protein TadD
VGMATRILLLGALTLWLGGGCATWEGARLYRDGTRALDRGETEVAIADLERASVLVPERSEIQNHLGIAYQAAGRDADALLAFERAVALDCDNRAAQENLSVAELRQRRDPP